MRQALVSIGVSLVVLLVGGGLFNFLANSRPAPVKLVKAEQVKTVKTRIIKNGESKTEISITGRLDAKEEIEVFAEVGGTYLGGKKPFKEGNYFKKGEEMINIRHDEFDLNLLAQKSSLMNQITLMLPDMKTDYPESFPKWQAYLKDMNLKENLKAFPEPASEKERYYLSSRNIYNLFYSIQSQEVRQEKYNIKAPFNGKVSASMIDEGTLVRAGQKLGDFYNPYFYEMEAAVNLKELKFVRPGSKVALKSSDIEGDWKGTVARISDVIDPSTQTVKVFINVRGQGLKEGMYLEGSIAGSSIDDVVELPRSLLVNDKSIWIKADSTLALHPIKAIKFTSQSAIVKGIPDGTEIINEPVVGAFEGMKIATYQ
ncbi:MAG: efflux RND transporter periplasmic adaptor subunit [Bacteroidia bacterium]|nr:efflux RND transporter periplasmic adaptor subunit [Bacteroidia bacterium]